MAAGEVGGNRVATLTARPRRWRPIDVVVDVGEAVHGRVVKDEPMQHVKGKVPQEEVDGHLRDCPSDPILERVGVEPHAAGLAVGVARVVEELHHWCACDEAQDAQTEIAIPPPPMNWRP
jgi:hypothetical protein